MASPTIRNFIKSLEFRSIHRFLLMRSHCINIFVIQFSYIHFPMQNETSNQRVVYSKRQRERERKVRL